MLALLLGLLASTAPAAPPATAPAAARPTAGGDVCAVDREALLALPPAEFDQDPTGGWRTLESKLDPCAPVAADLLADYRKAHWGTFTPQELHLNYWHEGQLRAIAGQTARALRLLAAGVHPGAEDPIDFLDYAVGTIAFLQRDLPALKAARKRLGKLPPPPGWAERQADMKARFGVVMAWPPNGDVLDGLIACFDKPYAKAYVECRPRPKPQRSAAHARGMMLPMADAGPRVRATHTRLTLSTLSDEEPALVAAVLSALPHEVREGLSGAATAGWIPAAWDVALARAMCLALGPAHARRIARLAMGRSMTGTLLGGLAGSALRLFGARPAALYGWAGRAWAHLCRDAGEMRLESHGASEALVVLSGQPAELAIPEYLGAISGGLEAILDACRARGDVEVVPRPDGAGFIARWAA